MSLYYDNDGVRIFWEDNLELLKELSAGSINLIYCDILYNTGKVFDDYSDDLGTPNEATEWYRPRIEEMRRVLADNGSVTWPSRGCNQIAVHYRLVSIHRDKGAAG